MSAIFGKSNVDGMPDEDFGVLVQQKVPHADLERDHIKTFTQHVVEVAKQKFGGQSMVKYGGSFSRRTDVEGSDVDLHISTPDPVTRADEAELKERLERHQLS
jgi:predicted nucleotidyltransferase